jgi:hypothetical protein
MSKYFVLFKQPWHADGLKPVAKNNSSGLVFGEVIGEDQDGKLMIRHIIWDGWRYLDRDRDFYLGFNQATNDYYSLIDQERAKPLHFFNKSILLKCAKSTPRFKTSTKLNKHDLIAHLNCELSKLFDAVEQRTNASKEQYKQNEIKKQKFAEVIDVLNEDSLKEVVVKMYELLDDDDGKIWANRIVTAMGTKQYGCFCSGLPIMRK